MSSPATAIESSDRSPAAARRSSSETVRSTLAQLSRGTFSNKSDVTLALGVLVMVALMILPIRPWILDIFLSINLAMGAVLLMSSVLTPSGTRIYTFPTILVLTTLFRLALDVSSTRLILSEADAGQVIRSFGQFAASGSVVIGLVVFLIITLVQMIVISKGAERTADANATFVKESLQGRQMTIDLDAGTNRITAAEAVRLRQRMNLEVDFYGRMYGAMQFIKGDAIAGLVVAAINIVGGLILGVAVNKMPVGDALQTYTLLTIGAGLVSQIPALVGSIAGTILVSRISADDSASGLGELTANQFRALPQSLMLAAIMMFFLGLVPGMPAIPFMVLAAAAGTAGYRLQKREGATTTRRRSEAQSPSELEFAAPLELRISHELPPHDASSARIAAMQLVHDYGSESGIPFPGWTFVPTADPAPKLEVRRRGITIATGETWGQISAAVLLDFKLRPGDYFELEEGMRWLDNARLSGESSHALLARQIGGDVEKTKHFYRLLRDLVIERIPIRDTRTIVDQLLLSGSSTTFFTGTAIARREIATEIRRKIAEATAAFHLRYFWDEGASRFITLSKGGEFDAALQAVEANGSTANQATIDNLIRRFFSENGVSGTCIVVPGVGREALYRQWEVLFRSGQVPRPVIALLPEESAAKSYSALTPMEL